MLLSLALVIALPAGTGDVALEPSATSHEPAPPRASLATDCSALFGSARDRESRRASREARLEEVSRTDQFLDVTYSDPLWGPPTPMRVPGLEIKGFEEGPDGKALARVRLSEAWSATCPAGDYLVGPDDGLGTEGLVLALVDEGVLAEHKGALIFLPRTGAHAPQFRLIWRSGFALNVAAGKNSGLGGGRSTAAAPKAAGAKAPRQDARQRKKAAAKAAAENRRNMATRPVRPRG